MRKEISLPNSRFCNPCKLLRVIDGDTFYLRVDVPFRIQFADRFRMEGYDSPERRTPRGKMATAFAARWLVGYTKNGWKLWVYSKKHGKYRWLGTIYAVSPDKNDVVCLNDAMIDAGHIK